LDFLIDTERVFCEVRNETLNSFINMKRPSLSSAKIDRQNVSMSVAKELGYTIVVQRVWGLRAWHLQLSFVPGRGIGSPGNRFTTFREFVNHFCYHACSVKGNRH